MRYQKIYTQIWHDEKFISMSEDARLLFLYILTSPHSNAIGLFVLPEEYICADLHWSPKRFAKPFGELFAKGLIDYDKSTRVVCILNHLKHNPIENENQAKNAARVLSVLPETPLFMRLSKQLGKQYHKPLLELLRERYAKPETEAVTETETVNTPAKVKKEEIPYQEIIDHLNAKTGKRYSATSEDTKEHISARWKDGYRLTDFKTAIDNMFAKWGNDPERCQFLRPATLFAKGKFDGYVNLIVTKKEREGVML